VPHPDIRGDICDSRRNGDAEGEDVSGTIPGEGRPEDEHGEGDDHQAQQLVLEVIEVADLQPARERGFGDEELVRGQVR
jgi:hypothetical protein